MRKKYKKAFDKDDLYGMIHELLGILPNLFQNSIKDILKIPIKGRHKTIALLYVICGTRFGTKSDLLLQNLLSPQDFMKRNFASLRDPAKDKYFLQEIFFDIDMPEKCRQTIDNRYYAITKLTFSYTR